MRRRRLLAISGALLAGTVAGCAGASDQPNPNEAENPSNGVPVERPERAPATALTSLDNAALETLVAQTNGFTIDLHRQLLADRGDENVFSSPISASMAFAMTYAGARGETRQQLREAFRYPEEDLHATMGKLQSQLDKRGSENDTGGDTDDETEETPFQLSIANSVWGQKSYSFRQEYLDTLAEEYDTKLNKQSLLRVTKTSASGSTAGWPTRRTTQLSNCFHRVRSTRAPDWCWSTRSTSWPTGPMPFPKKRPRTRRSPHSTGPIVRSQ
jgi:Serine protease inhibitor